MGNENARDLRTIPTRSEQVHKYINIHAYGEAFKLLDMDGYGAGESKILSELLTLERLSYFNRTKLDELAESLIDFIRETQNNETRVCAGADADEVTPRKHIKINIITDTAQKYQYELLDHNVRMHQFEAYVQLVVTLVRRGAVVREELDIDNIARILGLKTLTLIGNPITMRECLIYALCANLHAHPNSVIQNWFAADLVDNYSGRVIPLDVLDIIDGYMIVNWTKRWRTEGCRFCQT